MSAADDQAEDAALAESAAPARSPAANSVRASSRSACGVVPHSPISWTTSVTAAAGRAATAAVYRAIASRSAAASSVADANPSGL